jgi:hypothetical protein
MISCAKCFITLEKLKKDGIGDYMLKAVNEDGEFYICKSCLDGWTN